MAPVHADLVDRPVSAVAGRQTHEGGQEANELALAHLAGRHLEVSMVYRAQTADMAVDLYVVRRVGEHHLGALLAQQLLVGGLLQGAAAQEKVLAELPQVTKCADRRAFALQLRHHLLLRGFDRRRGLQAVEVDRVEPCDLEVEVDI